MLQARGGKAPTWVELPPSSRRRREANVMVMPHSLPLRVSFVAGPYIRPLRTVLTYPAWSGAPRVRFDKRQSFKKGLHGWTRGQSKTMKLEV